MPLFKLAGATGTVTSVGLTAPSSIFAVTGSPVTTAGVLALALVAQAANLVWAGPATGLPANPTFRALVAADIPDLSTVYQPLSSKLTAFAALANAAGVLTNNGSGGYSWAAAATGTVTSVALTVPSILSVAGSPITTSGTLAVSLATQAANLVFAGPGSGAAAAPTFRSLVALDIPDLSATYQPLNAKLTAISALANAAGVLTNNGSGGFSYTTPATGTVTSVSLTVPSFLSVAGSPITTSGTFTVTLATETANTVFAGPTTGAAAAPTFRALVAADFASIPATTFTMATARILGRTTAATGAVEELTAGSSLSLSAGSLDAIQDIRTSATPTFVGVNGASSLLLKIGGSTAVTIDSSKHVGIGAAPDALFLLDVVGSIVGTSARVMNSTGNGIELQTGTAPNISAQNRGSASYLNLTYQGLSHAWYTSTTLALTLDSSQNASFVGHVGIGQAADTTVPLIATLNGTIAPAPLSGTALQVLGANSTNARIFIDAFAAIPVLNLRRADGTNASKSAVQLDEQIGAVAALGYGATVYATGARSTVAFVAAENWTDTAQGTYLDLLTTPTGSTTNSTRARITAAGNLLMGTTSETGLTGASNARLAGSIYIDGSVGIGTPGTSTERLAILSTADDQPAAHVQNSNVGAGSAAVLRVQADTATGNGLSIIAHSSARIVTRFGLTLGSWHELLSQTSSNGIVMGTQSTAPIVFGTNNLERMRIDSSGNCIHGTAALATSATSGFLYIAGGPGTPTGTPTAATGRYPFYYDSSANKLWIYNGSWRGVVVT